MIGYSVEAGNILRMEEDGWVKGLVLEGETGLLPELAERCTRLQLDPVQIEEVLADFGLRVEGEAKGSIKIYYNDQK